MARFQLIANKVVAATIRVDDLGNKLKTAYRTLFTFAGQGAGSSRLKLYTHEIEKKQRDLGPIQNAAREKLEKGVAKLSDDQINERLLKFDGYLANLDRVREKFHVDLASVESQNQTYRQTRSAGPGSTTWAKRLDTGAEIIADIGLCSREHLAKAIWDLQRQRSQNLASIETSIVPAAPPTNERSERPSPTSRPICER